MNQYEPQEQHQSAIDEEAPADLKYWIVLTYLSFAAWLLHSYGIRFFFASVNRLIKKFL
jgi:hypothetical protein